MVNKISKILVASFFLYLIYLIINGYINKCEVENAGEITVGKYVLQDSWGKGECNYLIFYINGIKYKGNGGRVQGGFKSNIGKFYKIKYSKTNPKNITAFFDKEIKDTTLILKAGFSREDIKNMPK